LNEKLFYKDNLNAIYTTNTTNQYDLMIGMENVI
jgi:hypothetical protein